MEDLFKKVRELKTKAKNRRDLERYKSAASVANLVIQILESALASPEATEKSKPPDELQMLVDQWRQRQPDATEKSEIADQLADCYGLLGGIYRRWGLISTDPQERLERLQESFNAYDTGYQKYEASEEYKIANSYNLLNRLVSYMLINPAAFSDATVNLPDGQTLKKELERAGENIDQQKLERRGDIWAVADLALVKLLLDRESPVAAYADFIAASPADYVYDSVLSVLRPLAALQLPVASNLQKAVELLEGKLKQIRPDNDER